MTRLQLALERAEKVPCPPMDKTRDVLAELRMLRMRVCHIIHPGVFCESTDDVADVTFDIPAGRRVRG